MDKPLLTIITVTYNAGQFLERTLNSVQSALAHVAEPAVVEYLIIDGLSSDNTLEIARSYPFISKVISEKDAGLYDAMNKGQALASGRYLWFLNAGDEIFDESILRKLLLAFETDRDIYYSDAMMVRDNGAEVGLRSVVTPHQLPEKLKWTDFGTGMKVCHQAFLPKKSICPTYDIQNLSADIDWEINCLKNAASVSRLNFVLCKYLMGGLSIQNHKKSLSDRFSVLRKHFGLTRTLWNHLQIAVRGFIFARTKGKYW